MGISRGMPKTGMSSLTPEPKNGSANRQDASGKPPSRRHGILWTVVVFLLGAILVGVFFYFDRHSKISNLILTAGTWGILFSILLMALFCVIPVPAEFLLILDMKVYGVWWGILYSWLGAMAGSIIVFLLSRYVASGLLRSFVSDETMDQVTAWVGRRGITGLLLVHILPLPFIVVNYAAGVIRSVSLWNFTWTTAIGGVPYYLGAALVFLGISKKYVVWLAIGGIAIVAVWIAGYIYKRNYDKQKRLAR